MWAINRVILKDNMVSLQGGGEGSQGGNLGPGKIGQCVINFSSQAPAFLSRRKTVGGSDRVDPPRFVYMKLGFRERLMGKSRSLWSRMQLF
jgi:hypothetical protein